MDVELDCSDNLKYHDNGGDVKAKFVTISAFSMRQLDTADMVEALIKKALGKVADSMTLEQQAAAQVEALEAQKALDQKKADAEKEGKELAPDKIDGNTYISYIAMYGDGDDLKKFHLHMKKLLTSGVAYLDAGTQKLDGSLIDLMNPKDFKKLCAEYIGNFIIA